MESLSNIKSCKQIPSRQSEIIRLSRLLNKTTTNDIFMYFSRLREKIKVQCFILKLKSKVVGKHNFNNKAISQNQNLYSFGFNLHRQAQLEH